MDIRETSNEADTGTLSITLHFPDNAGVKTVEMGLYSVVDDTALVGYEADIVPVFANESTVTYTQATVPVGYSRFKAVFYADDDATVVINTYRELVCIAADCTSSADRTIEKLNELYSITYKLDDGSFATGYTYPEVFSRSSIIKLPTAQFVSKDGYVFCGWYESEDFSDERIFSIQNGNTENKTLYAKWSAGSVVTTANIGSLDLSEVSEDYTLSVVGDVSLSTLAEKLTQTQAAIAIDLTAATATELADEVFNGCTSLASVTLSENTTAIGEKAFYGCTSLLSVAIPQSVASIGLQAFAGCTSLKAITVSDANVSYCAVDGVLYNADKTTLIQYPAGTEKNEFVIPNGVVTIATHAFDGTAQLTNLTISSSVEDIQSAALSCPSVKAISVDVANTTYRTTNNVVYSKDGKTLVHYPQAITTASFSLPSYVTTIGDYAFVDCIALTTVTVPNNSKLENIGEYAFSGCNKLQSITVPDSVISVGGYAFKDCSELASALLTLNSSYAINAFYGCTTIQEIELTGIGQIASTMIPNKTKIKMVTIANNFKGAEDSCFYGCQVLEKIKYLGTKDEWDAKIVPTDYYDLPFTCKLIFTDSEIKRPYEIIRTSVPENVADYDFIHVGGYFSPEIRYFPVLQGHTYTLTRKKPTSYRYTVDIAEYQVAGFYYYVYDENDKLVTSFTKWDNNVFSFTASATGIYKLKISYPSSDSGIGYNCAVIVQN